VYTQPACHPASFDNTAAPAQNYQWKFSAFWMTCPSTPMLDYQRSRLSHNLRPYSKAVASVRLPMYLRRTTIAADGQQLDCASRGTAQNSKMHEIHETIEDRRRCTVPRCYTTAWDRMKTCVPSRPLMPEAERLFISDIDDSDFRATAATDSPR